MIVATTPGMVVALLLGGLGLMLYGVRLATAAVQRAAGARIRQAMLGLDGRPLVAFAVGVLATAVSQSSGAISAMLVGMVGAGLVALSGAVGVLLGANVGSTLALGLLALHVTDYTVALAGLGAAAALLGRRLHQPAAPPPPQQPATSSPWLIPAEAGGGGSAARSMQYLQRSASRLQLVEPG